MALEIEDLIADAVDWYPDLVVGSRISSTQDVFGFTSTPEEPVPLTYHNGKTAWIKLVMPERRHIQIDTEGSDYDTVLIVWDAALTTVVQFDDDSGTGTTSYLERWLDVGTYYVEIVPWSSSSVDSTRRNLNLGVTLGGFGDGVPADAVLLRSQQSSFSLSAVVWGGRVRHHRQRDHFGVESDLYVALSEPLGPWETDTPIRYVVQELLRRISALDSTNHRVGAFTLDAFIPSTYVLADAVLLKNVAGSFALDAFLDRHGSFTVDSWIRGAGSFTIAATIV